VDADPAGPAAYEKATLSISAPEGLHEVPTGRVAKWVRTVVETESPVHQRVVTRRIMNAAGISRMGRRIRESVAAGARHAERKGWIDTAGDVLLAPGQDEIPVRDRQGVDGVPREIELVPPQEIAAAVEEVVNLSFGIDKEDLIPEAGRMLGFGRVGSKIQDRIEEVVDQMLDEGRLARENGHLMVAE
jgi:hypothetical protein